MSQERSQKFVLEPGGIKLYHLLWNKFNNPSDLIVILHKKFTRPDFGRAYIPI